jgi:hypothetical protein
MIQIEALQRYRIDLADGATLTGPERLVVLVLKGVDGGESRYAISRVDAMRIALALQQAAAAVAAG